MIETPPVEACRERAAPKLNAQSEASRQVLDNLDLSVKDFVGKFRKASIRSVLPAEVWDMPVEKALQHSTTVRKLLIDGRFAK